jgi:hypothetical protein
MQMENAPQIIPTTDERPVLQGPLHDEGLRLMADRIEIRRKYVATCDVKEIHVSPSPSYPLIVRAHVTWTVGGVIAEGVEMIWRDKSGSGGGAAAVTG